MDAVLTMSEIESRYRDQWVLIDEIEMNELYEILSGKVRYSGQSRKEVYHKVMELKPKNFAVVYAGEFPVTGEFVL